jgi:dihydrofolate synthase/folylpolyglutamate synthase
LGDDLTSRAAGEAYEAALAYLFARTTAGIRLGLDRTTELLAELGDPHLRVPCVHIAGTNGKGSSVAIAAALLAARGHRVATYTSPHLVDFRERIVVGGMPISRMAVVRFVKERRGVIERLGATFFEVTTAMAFEHFVRAGATVAVIETGLGGRLDSTNVVDPAAAGVTSIARDHTEYLGETLEEIAREKGGIFKRGRPAVIGEPDLRLRDILAGCAEAVGASPVRVVGEAVEIRDVTVAADGTRFVARVAGSGDWTALHTSLVGRHQAANAMFAWSLFDAAGPPFASTLDEAAIAFPSARIAGRFQRADRFLFDVAHNAAGCAVLAESLEAVAPARPLLAVLCVLRDKDWRAMLRALAPVVDGFILTNAPTAPTDRAWNLEEVAQWAHDAGISARAEPSFDGALTAAATFGATILVTGSFHTVGDAMVWLGLDPFDL